jgi:hypothetical protein
MGPVLSTVIPSAVIFRNGLDQIEPSEPEMSWTTLVLTENQTLMQYSDFRLFGDIKSIIDVDSQVPYG